MFRRLRFGLVSLASVAILLAVVLVAPSSGAGSTPPRCSAANLRLDFVNVQGALSHRFWNLRLRNVGSATCRLKGFPGVALLDAHAKLINDSVHRQTGFKQRNVVLKPWQSAFFSFSYAVSGPCRPNFFFAYGIQVFPPNSAQRLVYYRGPFDVCGASLSHPQVYPVRPKLSPL